MSYTQVFDDGTTIVYGDDGRPVAYTDTDGTTRAADSSVANDFARLLLGVAQQAVNAAYRPAVTPAPAPVAPAGSVAALTASPWFGVALLAGAGFALYKLAS